MNFTTSLNLQINTRAVVAQKIKAQPDQALQLVIDGVAYVGQQQIKGKAVQLVRKGCQLEAQLQDQTVAVVEDFYASEGTAAGAAPGQAQALSAQDTLALLQEGSAVQVAAAPTGETAVALPQWGTLVAQASTSTTGSAPAAAAVDSAVPEAPGMGVAAALHGALGLAAIVGGSKSSSAALVPADTMAPSSGAQTSLTQVAGAAGVPASELPSSSSGGSSGGGATNKAATGSAALSGTAEEGGTLSADTTGITDSDGTSLQFSYQWQIADTAEGIYSDIANATASSHRLAADQSQVGKFVRVVVTASNDGTASGTRFTSAPSAAVATVNDAPVLADTVLVLSALGQNAAVPVGHVGDVLSVLLAGNVSDADGPSTLKGVAITGVDTSRGTLYFTTNRGDSWIAVGAVSNSSALLLADDGDTLLYFRPNAGFTGTVSQALTFRAGTRPVARRAPRWMWARLRAVRRFQRPRTRWR